MTPTQYAFMLRRLTKYRENRTFTVTPHFYSLSVTQFSLHILDKRFPIFSFNAFFAPVYVPFVNKLPFSLWR